MPRVRQGDPLRRALAGAAVAVVAACGLGGALAVGGDSGSGERTYRMVFDNAFGLVEGGDFRIGGVRAGQTTSFDIRHSPTGPPKAIVTATVTGHGVGDLRRDASCTIEPQSLVGEYFVDCRPGSSDERLPDGGTVALERNTGTIPVDLVNDVLRRPPRERLRLMVASLGTGVAGRAEDLQAVLRRAHPGLRETSETLRLLGDQNRTIESFITDADTVMAALADRRRDASRFVREAGRVAELGAARREDLRLAARRLPGLLGELRPSMARLAELAREGTPLASELQRAAPAATAVLDRTAPFAEEALPALRALGDASVPARQALVDGREEVRTLRRLALDAPATAKPLRQVLQTLDDRRRAVDDDPRARLTSPPPADPTHAGSGGGFTGFEGIANYFFWQSMTTNGFDAVGHLLRVGATVTKCSDYRNAPPRNAEDEQLFRDCNSWLGPRQPGINAPDPSVPATASRLNARSERPAERVGERRGPGEPDAGPLPGQRDVSEPQIVPPPGLRRLLKSVPEAAAPPPTPGGVPGDAQARSLLDYLLAP